MASSPQEVNPPKVFISYAWKNQPVAKQLQRDLIRDGVEVFVDYEKITGGDSLPDRISAALDWCNTLILLWSADSAESYYVKQEWTSAFHLQKRIIACVLDGTALPALLRGRLWLNFSPYETGYPQLCRSLRVEPKIVTPAPVPSSTLPPQHVAFPVGDQTPPSTEVRESPPPATRKPDPVYAKPAKKTKRWQPLLSKTKVFMPSGSAAARRVSAWWPRGKVMNITFAVIVVAAVFVAVRIWQSFSTISVDQAKTMLIKHDYYDRDLNPKGKGILHEYKLQHGDSVVFDQTKRLTWQQAGSPNPMTYAEAQKYIDNLNKQRFAGYDDWRLPTLEEAMSLMQPEKNISGLHIDPEFDRTQSWIWTADTSS
ncbi:MAG: TIR domain-containing protein, partial [bacterium]